MAYVSNIENNVILKLNLVKNNYFDVISSRSDFENWIPFEMILIVGSEEYEYLSEMGATFSVYEVKKFITEIEQSIKVKLSTNVFERIDFCSCEGFFDLNLFDPYEENQVYMEIWVNMANITNGVLHGYDKGFKFIVQIESLREFAYNLKEQLNILIENL